MITLPNGKSIDLDMLETAMEDSDLANRYFLNLVSGEEVFFSDYLGLSDEDERLSEEIDGSNDYIAIERIPSHSLPVDGRFRGRNGRSSRRTCGRKIIHGIKWQRCVSPF